MNPNLGKVWKLMEAWGGSQKDYMLWKSHNVDGTTAQYEIWKKANPDVILPKLPPVPRAPRLAPEIVPGARVKPLKEEKTQELKNFERETRLAEGDVQFNLYRRSKGRWRWCGAVDTCSREETAEEWGGGRFLLRRIDPATDQDMLGKGNELVFDIDETVYPSKFPSTNAFHPLGGPGDDAADVAFTREDLEEAEKKAKEKADLEAKIVALSAQAFRADAPKDSMQQLKDMLEIQRMMSPGVNIGEAKPNDPAALLNSVMGMVTAGLAIWEKVKTLVPAPAPAGSTMTERLLESAVTQLGPILAAKGQAQAQPQGGPHVIEAAPAVQTEEAMFESTTNVLKARLAEGQKTEKETGADTVMATAQWILAQKGFAWNIIKNKVLSTPDEEIGKVVDYIGTIDPTLTDSDFKKSWLENVCGIMQDLSHPAEPAQAAASQPKA